jgi:CHAD domain-containing protein
MPTASRGQHLLDRRLEQFTKMLQRLDRGEPLVLHRARVASRRLRAVLPVLRLDANTAHRLGRRLRQVTRRLGTVRSLDVLLMLVGEWRQSGRFDDAMLVRLSVALQEEREKAWRKLRAKLPVSELRRIAAKLEKIADQVENVRTKSRDRAVPDARGRRWAVDAIAARRATALATAIDEAGAVYLSERLHNVRVAVKKLRYAAELQAEITGKKSTPDIHTLKRGQDEMGRLHDLQSAVDRIRAWEASQAPQDLASWRELDSLVASLERDCRRLHARYMHNREALLAVCHRLGACAPAASKRRAG